MALDLRDLEVFLAVARQRQLRPRRGRAPREPAGRERAHPASRTRGRDAGVRTDDARRDAHARRRTAPAVRAALRGDRRRGSRSRPAGRAPSASRHRGPLDVRTAGAAARARRARRTRRDASRCATRTHTKSRHSCSTASPTSASRYPAAHDAACAGSRSRPTPCVCVAAPDHPLTSIGRVPFDALAESVLAVNAWGDARRDVHWRSSRSSGVEDWRIRHCGDAATAVTLARDHGHVAFVTASTASSEIRTERLRALNLAGMPRWIGARRPRAPHRRPRRSDDCARPARVCRRRRTGRFSWPRTRAEHLGRVRVARRRVGGFEVEPQQRLGVARPQVEPPVAAVDGEPVEPVLRARRELGRDPLDHRERDRRRAS